MCGHDLAIVEEGVVDVLHAPIDGVVVNNPLGLWHAQIL